MTKKQRKERNRLIGIGGLFVVLLLITSICPIHQTIRAILFIAVYLLAGQGVLRSAVSNLFRGQMLDEKFLMAIATLGALAIGEYAEAVFVMIFFQVGEWFEKVAVGNSRKSIAALMDIRPDTARVEKDGESSVVSAENVSIGDIMVVYAGERVALDGVITEGASALDKSALTGESLPQDVGEGDTVMSGSISLSGMLKIRVTQNYEQSTASRILALMEESVLGKAPIENFITRFAHYYTPAVVIAALLLAVIPSLVWGNWQMWLHKAIVLLVVSCPCALVISVPLTFFSAIGGAGRHGILVKGAAYLEQLSKVRGVVFDKTGTLTQGEFFVSEICALHTTKQELLSLAALAESHSNHPIARSIKNAYEEELNIKRIAAVKEFSGFGVCAEIDGKNICVGNAKLMVQQGITLPETESAQTIVFVSEDTRLLGYICVADKIRDTAKQTVCALREKGLHTVMLTGDRKEIGEQVAQTLGVDEVYTELLPKDKVELLQNVRQKIGRVAFIGDGINDAPVLASADVGIAMGAIGSDAAIEAADIVLMQDTPLDIVTAFSISDKVRAVVRQNIVFALGVKFGVMALALLGYENMWLAGFADVGVSVIAILNAVRVMKMKF